MTENRESYRQGERVPEAGTYRCSQCGELWTATESGVRFPPCDACKSSDSSWVLVDRTSSYFSG